MVKISPFFNRFASFSRIVQLHPWLLYYDFIFILLGIGGGGIERHSEGYVVDLKYSKPDQLHRRSQKIYSEFLTLFNNNSTSVTEELKYFALRMGRCKVTLDCLTIASIAEGNIAVHSVLERRYGRNLNHLDKLTNTKDASALFLDCEKFQIHVDDWLLDYAFRDPVVRTFRYLEPDSPEIFAKFFKDQLTILNLIQSFPVPVHAHTKR